MICLDNSVLSRFASPESSPAVDTYLEQHAAEPWTIPATVAFEYYVQFESQSEVRRQNRILQDRFDGILPLTNDVVSEAARLRIALEQQNVSLPIGDLLNVATAHVTGATFVTRDVDDFDRDPVLQLLDVDLIDP